MPIFRRITARGTNRTLFIAASGQPSPGSGRAGPPIASVYDGDTARALLPGTQGLRFLGCDTAELAYRVPVGPSASKATQDIAGPLWDAYLADPFRPGAWPPFPEPGLHPRLVAHLAAATGPGCAANHARHAEAAKQALQGLIAEDQAALGLPDDEFRFFLAFAHEVLDGYGRPLVFVSADVREPALRRGTYNERQLANGAALPYFIFPNVDPFRERVALTDAAFPPPTLRREAAKGSLGAARRAVANARAAGMGVFAPADPLRLAPFELRMLGDRKLPSRWVIDLGAEPDDPTLYPPHAYHLIAKPEDRLFVPPEFVPLFVEKGWQRGILIE